MSYVQVMTIEHKTGMRDAVKGQRELKIDKSERSYICTISPQIWPF